MTKWFIHINRGVIDSNRKHKKNDPPIKFQKGKYGKATYAHSVELSGTSRIIYNPEGHILLCGARLVIESDREPIIME